MAIVGGLVGNVLKKATNLVQPRTAQASFTPNIVSSSRAAVPASGPSNQFQVNPGNTPSRQAAPGLSSSAVLGSATSSFSTGGTPTQQTSSQPSAPQQQTSADSYFEPAPTQPTVDFDALIAPALDAYNQTESAVRAESDADIQAIEKGGETRKQTAEGARKASDTQFQQRAEKTTSAAENAINESRRAASELQQGLAARYGSSISTGLGAQSILGAQAVKNIGSLRTQLAGALNEIEVARTGVQETYNNALKEIDLQTETSKQQARATLQSNLATIGQGKAELQSRKAELAYQAMEQYRQEVNAVNQRNTAFKQQLELQRQSAEQRLEEIRVAAQNKYSSLSTPDFQFGKDGFGNFVTLNKKTGTGTQTPIQGTTGTQDPNDLPNLLGTTTPEEDQFLQSY